MASPINTEEDLNDSENLKPDDLGKKSNLQNTDVLPARCGDSSLRVNEAERIHCSKDIARRSTPDSHRKLDSVLPKFGENAPEEGGDHGQGAHQVFGAPLVR